MEIKQRAERKCVCTCVRVLREKRVLEKAIKRKENRDGGEKVAARLSDPTRQWLEMNL